MPELVKEFYDLYYDKSTVVVVTRGSLDRSHLDEIEALISKYDTDASMNSNQFDKELVPADWYLPRFDQDYYIFTNTTKEPLFHFECHVAVPSDASDSVVFLETILEEAVHSSLSHHGLSKESTVSIGFDMRIASLEIDVQLTDKGRKNVQQVIFEITQAIKSLSTYNTEETFLQWAEAIKAKLYITSIADDPADLTSTLTDNFMEFGLGRLFVGRSLLNKFNHSQIADLIESLLIANRIFIYHGIFDSPNPDYLDAMSFFKGDVSQTQDVGSSEPKQAQYGLNMRAEIPDTDFTFFTLSHRVTNRLLLHFNSIEETPIVYPSKFIPSPAFLTALSNFKPSGRFENTTDARLKHFSHLLNEKYQIPLFNIYINLNPKLPATQHTYIWMKYYTEILNRRANKLLKGLSDYRNSIEFFLNSFGITLQLNLLVEQPQALLELILDKTLQTTISEEEQQYAIKELWALREDNRALYEVANDVFSKVYINAMATPVNYLNFAPKIAADKNKASTLPRLFIGWVHLEQTTFGVAASEVTRILDKYDHEQLCFLTMSERQLIPNKVLLIRELAAGDKQKQSKAYISCHYLGRSAPEVRALGSLLVQIITNIAYDYLRTQKAIGYMADVNIQEIKHDSFVCLTVQGDKDLTYIEDSVEEFYQVAEDFISGLSETQIRSTADSLAELSAQPFDTPEKESIFWYYYSISGFGIDYNERMMQYLKSVSKESFLSEYLRLFKHQPRRVIAEVIHRDFINAPQTTQMYAPQSVIERLPSEAFSAE